ncbi:neuroglian-like [Tubulanus polymorphus]|uniref:neuroglian-like n=1 Tax=Tubulanus polymorphus TaxID=672921 RepID=UPI003DA38929
MILVSGRRTFLILLHLVVLTAQIVVPKAHVKTCSGRYVHIVWDSSNRKVVPRLYNVEYSLGNSSDIWYDGDTVGGAENGANFELPGNRKFRFRVTAYYSNGRVDQPEPVDGTCSTNPDRPDRNPDDVRGKAVSPNKIIISWEPLSFLQWNAPNLMYTVRWRRSGSADDWSTAIVDGKGNSYEINHLTVHTSYEFSVESVNARGSPIDKPVINTAYSGEDVPSLAPTNFKVSPNRLDPKTVLFTWNALNTSSTAIRGQFKSYRIHVINVDNTSQSSQYDVIGGCKSSKVCGFVRLLAPNCGYHAYVVVVNGKYEGPASNRVYFKTTETKISSFKIVDLKQIGRTTLRVRWVGGRNNGHGVTAYKLVVHRKANNSFFNIVRTILVEKAGEEEPYSAAINGLVPGHVYRVYVYPIYYNHKRGRQSSVRYADIQMKDVAANFSPDAGKHIISTAIFRRSDVIGNYRILRTGLSATSIEHSIACANDWNFGWIFISVAMPFFYMFQMTRNWCTVLLSLERLIVVLFPIKSRQFPKKRISTWAMAFILLQIVTIKAMNKIQKDTVPCNDAERLETLGELPLREMLATEVSNTMRRSHGRRFGQGQTGPDHTMVAYLVRALSNRAFTRKSLDTELLSKRCRGKRGESLPEPLAFDQKGSSIIDR